MNRNQLVLLLAGLGLLGTAGCMEVSEKAQSGTRYVITGHPGGAYQPRNVNKYDLENSAKFVLLDKGVERSVTCPNIEERINDDGRMEVIANVRNRLNRRIEVQVNCVFKDDKGFPTNDEAPFKTLILDENAQEGVRFISMNNQRRASLSFFAVIDAHHAPQECHDSDAAAFQLAQPRRHALLRRVVLQ